MSAWPALLLAVLAAAGPNGFLLHHDLRSADTESIVPVAELARVTPRLYVVYHEMAGWPRALYIPAAGSAAPPTLEDLLLRDPRFERSLPSLRLPRLLLFRPHFMVSLDGSETPRPIRDMPVDVANGYFTALLAALFDLRPDLASPLVESRADELMREARPADRASAYLGALGDFGAHVLTTAVEIRRSLERQRAAGKNPCLLVDHPATLFGLWSRIFSELEYFGHHRLPEGGWVRTRAVLEPRDKKLFVERILAGRFRGDVRHDFGLDCP